MNESQFASKKALGIKTIIFGCCMITVDLFYLPVYAYLEQLRNGDPSPSRTCISYVSEVPMMIALLAAGVVVLMGLVLLLQGSREKRN